MNGSVHATSKGRRWLLSGHPWLYRDDVASADAEPGSTVAVLDPQGARLGWGLFSARSRICVRLISRDRAQPDAAFWDARVARALALRARLGLLEQRGACRLLAGDADLVPGLVVDRYADVLVCQSGTLAADRLRDGIVERLLRALPFAVSCVHDRSDAKPRALEGLEQHVETVQGELPAQVVVAEAGLEYAVDLRGGHKTGHYLDQRDNRQRASRLAAGRDVLDTFSYDGLFGLFAARAGARSVLCLDQSRAALDRALANAERNGLAGRIRVERADCMQDLKAREQDGERYGLVIADPPAFARNRREAEGAARGYIELNRRALALTGEDGWLVSASCSYNVSSSEFLGFLARAARAAGREAWLEEFHGAAPDHPVLLTLPESSYLKCAFVRAALPPGGAPVDGADAGCDVRSDAG